MMSRGPHVARESPALRPQGRRPSSHSAPHWHALAKAFQHPDAWPSEPGLTSCSVVGGAEAFPRSMRSPLPSAGARGVDTLNSRLRDTERTTQGPLHAISSSAPALLRTRQWPCLSATSSNRYQASYIEPSMEVRCNGFTHRRRATRL